MTTTTRKLSARKSSVAGWEVVDEQGTVVTVVKNRDQARAAVKELATADVAEVLDAVVAADLTEAEVDEVEAQADAGDGFEWDDMPEVVAEVAVEAAAQVEEELAVEQAAPVVEETDEAPVEAQVAEEQGASVDDVLEAVAALRGLVTLSRTKLAAMVEGDPAELLAAMDQVRTVLASRTKVRLYASKLTGGQRISLREAGVVTVTDVVKVAQRKVLVQWTDAAGVAGEREMGSWQWITLA